jgi:CheY-like chemotaxis protein
VRLDGTNRERVRFEVHNQGVIPESLLPSLFDPFRGTQKRREGTRGLGLGLFIVREIVHAHGGTVNVESSQSHGTTFRIELPRHPTGRLRQDGEQAPAVLGPNQRSHTEGLATSVDDVLPLPAEANDESATRPQGPPILLVDDDPDIREALAETLEDHGFTVATASNGVDALRQLRRMRTRPALVLLDLMMPVMDGYGFLDERRKDPTLASIPVVVITAGHGFDRNRLGETTTIVPKPINLPKLLDALRAVQANENAK